jgi:hypothetical protein
MILERKPNKNKNQVNLDRKTKHPDNICTIVQQFVVIYIRSNCQEHQAKYYVFSTTFQM